MITLDPGKRHCGVGCSVPGDGAIRFAATIRTRTPGKLPAAVISFLRLQHTEPQNWLVEKPQTYAHGGGRERDLEALRSTIRTIKSLAVAAGLVRDWREVYPSAWKGQVPKHVHHLRVIRELTITEAQIASGLDLDGMDAVGLNLWGTGRTGRGGTTVPDADPTTR